MIILDRAALEWEYWSTVESKFVPIAFPCSPDFKGTMLFRMHVDSEHLNYPVLFISSLGVPFEVVSNGKLLYKFGDEISFLGFPAHFIPLPFNSRLVDFKVNTTSYNKGICREIMVSNYDSIYHYVVSDNIGLIVSSSAFLLLALVSFGLFFILKKQRIFLYLSFFIVSATLWQFSNNSNPLKDLIFRAPKMWGYLDIFSLYFLPVAFLILSIKLVSDRFYLLRTGAILHAIFFLGVIVASRTGYNIADSIKIFNIIFSCVSLASLIFLLVQSVISKKRFLFIGVFTIILFAVHDLLLWANLLVWTRHLTPIGFVIFVVFLGIQSMFDGYKLAKEAIDAQARMTLVREIMHNIAHDIRRPFSMLWQILAVSGKTKHLDKINEAMRSVDGILSDIMDVDAKIELRTEKVLFSDLLLKALHNIYSMYPEEKIVMWWDFDVDYCLDIDKSKFLRVIENIIQNAVEATFEKDRELTFGIRLSVNNEKIIFVIKNSKSFIENKIKDKIFEPYFTYKKYRGKGIGLAICKRFVEAHGGHVGCVSFAEGEGECSFELEFMVNRLIVNRVLINDNESFPRKWDEIKDINLNCNRDSLDGKTDIENIEKSIRERLVVSSGNVNICIVDDESVFANSVMDILKSITLNRLEGEIVPIDHLIIEKVLIKKYDGYVLDFDLGLSEINGVVIAKNIIEKYGRELPIILLSNRTVSAINSEINGLDIILKSKPATRENMLLFASHALHCAALIKPRVVIVDDESYILSAWKEIMTDATVLTFENPDDFYEAIIDNKKELATVNCIILDFYFKKTDIVKERLVRTIRKNGYKNPVLLSSNVFIDLNNFDIQDRFDAVIPKKAVTFSEILNIDKVKEIFDMRVKEIFDED